MKESEDGVKKVLKLVCALLAFVISFWISFQLTRSFVSRGNNVVDTE